jgi:hypothetical protein
LKELQMFDRRGFSVLGILLFFVAATAMAGAAKGTFMANDKKFDLKFAHATTIPNPFDKKKTDTFLVVTDKEIPPGSLFDEFELMQLADKGISGFTVEWKDDQSVDSGTLFSPAFKKVQQFSMMGRQKVALTTNTKDRIAGTVSVAPDTFFDDKYQYTATFDIPIETKTPEKPVVLKGTKLPADGGEPAKAWQAYRKAIQSGDVAAIRKSVAKDLVKDTEDPDFKKMLGVIQAMQPKKVKINGGSVDGDKATLLVTSLDEKNTTGTVTMVRENGQWKLSKEDWKTKAE